MPTMLLRVKGSRPAVLSYVVTGLLLAGLFAPFFFFKPVRVGDGSEYYALFFAIRDELHLWMTAAAFDHYQALVNSNTILGLVSVDPLREAFPSLRVGATADFNHFWFYSLLSAFLAKSLAIVGIHIGAHAAFVLQHALLLLVTTWLALYLFGRLGVAAVLLLTLASPMVWFADKVHTEFFTYCLVLCAVMLAQKQLYIWGALCLALTSTQNPSFALLAFVLLLLRLPSLSSRPIRFWEALALVGTCVIVLLHPAYYYFRFGVPTPQMFAGGAKIGANASSFYIWLLDPDVGLLPNWPLGIGLIIVGVAGIFKRGRERWSKPFALFLFLYLLVNLFAQSSTLNINSGATPGLARYALWYIPLFFPLALVLLESIASKGAIVQPIAVALLLVYCAANVRAYDPRQYESYLVPSPLSRAIQRSLPGLYDPPPEVFIERFSGYGESPKTYNLGAILGPSCDKLLIFPGRDPSQIAQPAKCLLDEEKLRAKVQALQQGAKEPTYARLPEAARDISFTAGPTYEVRTGQRGARLLGDGWSQPEEWGTWSASDSADLRVPCPSNPGPDSFKVGVSVVGFEIPGAPPVTVKLSSGRTELWTGEVRAKPVEAIIALQRGSCGRDGSTWISFKASPLRSPKEAGMSDDPRKLGVGLTRIYYP